jgi:hypothetical protein
VFSHRDLSRLTFIKMALDQREPLSNFVWIDDRDASFYLRRHKGGLPSSVGASNHPKLRGAFQHVEEPVVVRDFLAGQSGRALRAHLDVYG